jgi:hypothetical protein
MMELLMLMALIFLVFILITITGDLYYVQNRNMLAAKCLILDDYDKYYDFLKQQRINKNHSETYTYGGQEDLKKIFFPSREVTFDVEPPRLSGSGTAGRDDNGENHMPTDETGTLGNEARNYIVNIVNKTRGAHWATVKVEFKPTLFWPDAQGTLQDSVYLAASDWRYDELPGGYIELLTKKLRAIPGAGKILEWIE